MRGTGAPELAAVVSGKAEDRAKVLSGVDVAFLFRSLRDLCFVAGCFLWGTLLATFFSGFSPFFFIGVDA